MKTIMITGGAGFIGSNLVRYLFENYPGYRITVLDALTYAGNIENIPENVKNDARFSFWYGNVRNNELVNDLVSKSDVVLHLAAESHVARSIHDNAIFFETDVLGTQVVANAVLKQRDTVERCIHISTSDVYGTAETDPMTEEHPLNPASPYAAAKTGADRLVYSYWVTYDLPVIIIRPFNNYGPYQHLEKVIPRFITSALLNEALTIHGVGDSTRDWVYVGDTCRALDRAIHTSLDKVKGEAINIGSGKDVSVKEIAESVMGAIGGTKCTAVNVGDRPGQVKRHISSTDKALRLLNWKTEMAFDIGLRKTIEWYQQNPDWWQRLLWMRHVPVRMRDGKIQLH